MIMIGNNWEFFASRNMQCNHSCAFQSQFRSSFWPGQKLFGTGWIPWSCWFAPNGTYWIYGSYLQAWLPPGWIGRCTLGLAFTRGFIFSELPENPADLLHLKTRWARSVFHWYDYLAAISIPSLGTQMLCYELML